MGFLNDMLTICLVFLGLLGVCAVFLYAKDVMDAFKKKMEDEIFVRKVKRSIAAVASVVVLGLIFIPAMKKSSAINADMPELLNRSVDEHLTYYINQMDERMNKAGVVGRLFVGKKDEYAALKQANDQLLDAAAAELSERIEAMEPFGKLQSVEQIEQISGSIAALKLDNEDWGTDRAYKEELERRTANYSELLAYEEAFEKQLKACRETCDNCYGDGKTSRSITCASCNGRGRKSVTWYSQGDWGTTSYSSYECTSCNGRGKNYSRTGCTRCTDGYVYHFE